jgi:GlpG protein
LRQIGTVPKGLDAKAFGDYLLSVGMKTRIDDCPEGWGVWIYNEDHLQRAQDELQAFLRQPDDPRYRQATQTAEAIRRNEKQLEKKFRKNYRDASDLWGFPSFRQRPFTTILFASCILIFIWQNLPPGTLPSIPSGQQLTDRLLFSSYTVDDRGQIHDFGLRDIESGEIWRLVTPALMHGNPLHILFNLLWLRILGTMIEVRRGTLRLLILVLVSAAASNYGQYAWMEKTGEPGPFWGLSGVVYALFGYVWMKGVHEPEQRLGIDQNNVNIMLFWLVLCMTGALGRIGNAAHVVGLVVGVVAGLMGL